MKPLVLALTLALTPQIAAASDWASVAAIFEDRCVFCHSGEDAPLSLSLDSHSSTMAGSENGPVVEVGKPEASPLLQRLTGQIEPRMPMDGPPWLSEEETSSVTQWIINGAQGPAAGTDTAIPAAEPPDPREDGQITYDEVAVIFGQRCIECHSDNSKLGAPPEGLRLDSLPTILSGGDRVVVIPGNPAASAMIRHIKGLAEPRMPLDGPPWLSDAQISLLEDWIAGGALSADGISAPIPTGRKLRIRGTLTALNAIDGVPFQVGANTRRKDALIIGTRAELRGHVLADGTIMADRLRAR